ncbi:hypothetical protein G4Y79_15480 [Phototrophicus methaneseepsis]|uniref:YtxH domain-containing protein n=1 Tax=Phototrophicus methaneseepsis TaxID=2710758 RepID=A0A7S8IDR9_9CHLR|nr:YtxH domain-containing protein [Phototrophicus methaneseepsis]QPC81103.1 hypothetical protein G4Y79_15480 [Phototrophicus methaneseepsis]
MSLFGKKVTPQSQTLWKDGYVFWGIVFGIVAGGMTRLLNSHKSGDEVRQQLQHRLKPGHSLDDSLEEGKAAARRLQTPNQAPPV